MNTTNGLIWDSFKDWLVNSGKVKESTANTINSRINRVKEAYSLEYLYAKDGCAELLEDFTYTTKMQLKAAWAGQYINVNAPVNYISAIQARVNPGLVIYIHSLKPILHLLRKDG